MTLKSKLAKAGFSAVATSMLIVAIPGSAYADGHNISWTQRETDNCLMWVRGQSMRVVTDDTLCWNNSDQGTKWDDVSRGLENQTGGFFAEKPAGSDYCLTSYWAPGGSDRAPVYLERCSTPVNYYEQWTEKWVGDGFQLVNRMTGWCLDANNSNEVYAMACHPQGKNKYQVWY